MKAFFVWIVLLSAALLSLLGCKGEKHSYPMDFPGVRWGSVQIVMMTDTLKFLPGDTATAQGFVVVKDDAGRVMPGVRVTMSLLEDFGFLEFTDSTLRDTTSANGRVNFRFGVVNAIVPSHNIIHAQVGSLQDNWTIWLMPAGPPLARLDVWVSKSEIQVLPPDEDSVLVTVAIADSFNQGVPGIELSIHTNGGRLAPLPLTDSAGVASTWWWTDGAFEGTYYFAVHAGGLSDTAWVHIVNFPQPGGAPL